ncbi:MAG: septum formation inhibitor Maf [Bacteroidetes bacterium]|nr:septum formation inhibitor Maf [Bacteroidota bacterium]
MISISVPIILASQSPRRAQLFRQIGLTFSVQPSSVPEEIDPAASPEANVMRLAALKAEQVAAGIPKGIVVGSDTIVVIDGEVLGKPSDAADAARMLARLSGRTHTVYTGFAVVDAGTKKNYIDWERTDVTFRRLSAEEIDGYIATGSPMDKAGSYGIQDDFGAVFVERIAGDYYTVVGFPLAKFYVAFTAFTRSLGYLKGTP